MKKSALLFVLLGFLFGCQTDAFEIINESPESVIQSLFAINDARSVTLGWTNQGSGVLVEYTVHRSERPNFTPSSQTFYRTLPVTATRFIDSAVTRNRLYYYRLVPVQVGSAGGSYDGIPSSVAIGRPYDYSSPGTIQYGEHIQPIFTSSCAVHGCHVGYDDEGIEKRGSLLKVQHGGQFSLKSWADLFDGSRDGAVAVPFKSSKSDLIFHTNSDTLIAPVAEPHMPLPGFDLPIAQLRTLIRWIDGGAVNDQGGIPYTITPKGKVFVVNASEDLIAVIDVARNLVIRYANVGKAADSSSLFGSPHHVRVDKQARFFYVTLISSQELWKFSVSTYELLGRVNIPFQPADVVLSSTGDTAYVSSFISVPGRVTLVNTRTMQPIGTISLNFASRPHGLVLSRNGANLFTTNLGSGNVTMIKTADHSQSLIALDTTGNPFASDARPYLADITPDDRYLYVTDFAADAGNIFVIDLLTDPTKPAKVIPIGGRSVHVAVSPNGQYAFVCNFDSSSVDVITTADYSVTRIRGVGRQPHGVIFTPDGSTAYVTTENQSSPEPAHHPTAGSGGVSQVTLIDVATLSIVKRIEVGAFGQGISITP